MTRSHAERENEKCETRQFTASTRVVASGTPVFPAFWLQGNNRLFREKAS